MRVGVDLGGTKIVAASFADDGTEHARSRRDTPRGYQDTVRAVAAAVAEAAGRAAGAAPRCLGVGLPGLVDAASGRVRRAANLPWLEGRPFAADLAVLAGCPVRLANDADAFVLSEATGGAAAGASPVFGAVLGTGAGGGLVADGRVLAGAGGMAGEWGHLPLPWRRAEDGPPLACGCGLTGCAETVVSGPGLAALHRHRTGETLTAAEVAARAAAGDGGALATLAGHRDALARALAPVILLFDPEAIVIGGGLSSLPGLCEGVASLLPAWMPARTSAGVAPPRLVTARFGADSGVRGAALLWPALLQPGRP